MRGLTHRCYGCCNKAFLLTYASHLIFTPPLCRCAVHKIRLNLCSFLTATTQKATIIVQCRKQAVSGSRLGFSYQRWMHILPLGELVVPHWHHHYTDPTDQTQRSGNEMKLISTFSTVRHNAGLRFSSRWVETKEGPQWWQEMECFVRGLLKANHSVCIACVPLNSGQS